MKRDAHRALRYILFAPVPQHIKLYLHLYKKITQEISQAAQFLLASTSTDPPLSLSSACHYTFNVT